MRTERRRNESAFLHWKTEDLVFGGKDWKLLKGKVVHKS